MDHREWLQIEIMIEQLWKRGSDKKRQKEIENLESNNLLKIFKSANISEQILSMPLENIHTITRKEKKKSWINSQLWMAFNKDKRTAVENIDGIFSQNKMMCPIFSQTECCILGEKRHWWHNIYRKQNNNTWV